MKKTRAYYFIRTLWDLIPAIWRATGNTNFDISVFHCNDKESWEKYLELKTKIYQIIDPNYQPNYPKGKIKIKLEANS